MINKDIQLCGLGNGLVDIQALVTDEEFSEIKANRGEMCLVDSQRHKEILDFLGKRDLNKCSGGSAANTIIAFSQMGGRAAYKTSLGNDELGRFYAGEFTDLKIELRANMLDEPTGICLILITPDSERTMLTSLAATAKYSKIHIDEELISRSEWLYLEGYRYTTPDGAEAADYAVDLAKKHNSKIAITFSDVFVINIFRDKLKKTIDNAHLVFCNEQEALAFTGEENIDKAFKKLTDIVPNAVVTLGNMGSWIKWNGNTYIIPVYPATLVDTTGAGDMFAAGFLHGLYRWNHPEKAGNLASLAAARIVSQLGARYAGDMKKLIDEIENKFS